MTKRFLLLMKCLHFVSNDVLSTAASKAEKSFDIRLFLNTLLSQFSSVCTLTAKVAIDESLVLWMGRLRLTMKQYIPLKEPDLD